LTTEQVDFSFERGDAFAKPAISNEDATANIADTFPRAESFISNRNLAS